jgi:hypothetical protein
MCTNCIPRWTCVWAGRAARRADGDEGRGEGVPLLYTSLTGLQSITQTSGSHSVAIVKHSLPFRTAPCASARIWCRTLQFKGRRLRTICFRHIKGRSRTYIMGSMMDNTDMFVFSNHVEAWTFLFLTPNITSRLVWRYRCKPVVGSYPVLVSPRTPAGLRFFVSFLSDSRIMPG